MLSKIEFTPSDEDLSPFRKAILLIFSIDSSAGKLMIFPYPNWVRENETVLNSD
jgi:hypothetical protein